MQTDIISKDVDLRNNFKEFRKFCLKCKPMIWSEIKSKSHRSKSNDVIKQLYLYFEQVDVEFKQERKRLQIPNDYRQDAASDIVFPIKERKLIALLWKPILASSFSIFRLNLVEDNEINNLETGLTPDMEKRTQTEHIRKDYLENFTMLAKIIQFGEINIKLHLEWILSSFLREVASAYMDWEQNKYGEIRCTWFQKLLSNLKSWSHIFKIDNIFSYAATTIYKDCINLLTENIYKIVVIDFPFKYRSIFTLRYCMQNTNNFGREPLTRRLIDDVEKYLLLASVETNIILNAYASCVESLREFDSTCVVMHRVCGVIKEYLKKRPDTVQQIITYITSDKKDELEKDMTNTKRSAMMDEDELRGVNDEFLPENMDLSGWYDWEPFPIDASLGESSHGRQSVDVFNMLVSVYGSKELFVKEYRTLLAERLSNSDRKDPEFEKRYLNLLKLRFQFSELQHCDVMLRDVEMSQQIDTKVKGMSSIPMSACIISSHYWPKIEEDPDNVVVPIAIENQLNLYSNIFGNEKKQRKLHWMKGVGCVELEIELNGVTIEKTLPNTHATVLYAFLEKESWTVNELVDKLKLSASVTKRRLEWLVRQGLLTMGVFHGSTSEVWSLTNNPNAINNNRAKSPDLFDEEEIVDDSSSIIESLEQYWSYTVNYITNHAPHGEVKAERMHRIYRMFGSPTSSGPTLDHVNEFLQRKVKQGLLIYVNGLYRVQPN